MAPAASDTACELEALTQFLYLAPTGLIQATMAGDIVMINAMAARLLMPLSRDRELRNLFDVLGELAPDLRHLAGAHVDRHGIVCDSMYLQVNARAPGRAPPQILSLTLLKLDDDRLMAVLNDVSASVHRERALRHSQAGIETVIAGVDDYAMATVDGDGKLCCWNPGVGRVTGYDAAQSIGHSFALFHPDQALSPERLLDRLHEARRNGWSLDEGWHQRADGSLFWGSCLITPLDVADEPRAGEPAFSLILRDISDHKGAHDALRQSASCDHLTGLANRRALFDAGELEINRWQRAPRPVALVLIDADHLKALNDRYGRPAGDAVLLHLGTTLAATFRPLDVVARVGGDEFAVLLPGATRESAAELASRLCRTIAELAIDVGGSRIGYTVSAGVATMEAGIEDIETLMTRADAALHAAKTKGRNRVECWRADLDDAHAARRTQQERQP